MNFMVLPPDLRRLGALRMVLLASALLSPAALHAATNTWDGGGVDGKISTAANWDADTAPATTGANIIFAGTTNLNVTNDSINALATANTALTFASGAGSFNVSGNAMTMGSGGGGGQVIIQQNSTNAQTIKANINLSGGNGDRSIVFGSGAGSLHLAGNINFGTASGDWLFPATTAGTIILSGTNTGDGKATAAVSAGSNTMRAMMRNNVGGTTLVLGSDGALGNSGSGDYASTNLSLRGILANQQLNISTTNGARNLSGSSLAINANNITYVGTNDLTIGNIISQGGSRDFVVTQPASVNVANLFLDADQSGGQWLYLNVATNAKVTVTGAVYDTFHSGGLTSGVSTLRKAGNGTLILSGNTSHAATNQVDAGTMLINGVHAPTNNSGRYVVASTATLGGNGTIKPYDSTGLLTGFSVSGTLSPGDPAGSNGLGVLTLDGTNSARSLLALETGAKMQIDLMTDTNSSRLSDKVAIIGANGSANEVFFNSNVVNFNDPTGILPAGDYVIFSADAANAFNSGTISVGTGLDIYASKAINRSGNNIVLTLGAASAATNAPPVPSGAAATAPEPYKVVLNWNHSYRATSYTVRRGTVSGFYSDLATVTAPSTTYTDTTATPGTIYYYVVAAVNTAGTSANAVEVTGASYEPRGIGINLKPAASAGMTTSDRAGAVRLSKWNNMTGPTGAGNAQTLVNPLDSSGAVVGMTVAVTGGSGSSTFAYNSASGNDSTMFDTVFDQFDGTAGTISVTGVPYSTYDVYFYMRDDGSARGGSFTIGGATYYVRGGKGNPATNGTNYILSTATTNGGTNTPQGNYVRFSGLTNTNFTCSFVAFNAGESVQRLKLPGFQIVAGAPVATVPPGTPANLSIAPTSLSAVTLSWGSASGATEYRVYRSTSPGSFDYNNPLATLSATSTTYSDITGVAGTTYYYVVRAANSVGVSEDSAQVSTPAPDLSSVAVSSPVIWPGQSSTFTWSVPNATGITINDGSGAQSNSASNSLTVTLDATKTYTFSATNAQGTSTRELFVTVVPKPDTRDALWQWSVQITNSGASSETKDYPRAFLYIPPAVKRLRGVIIGQHNMLEEPILEHKAVRQGLADASMAAIWVSPAFDGNFNFTANTNTPATFQEMMDKLAAASGYSELSNAPVVWIGHSAMAEAPYFFAAWDTQNSVATGAPKRCAAAISVKGWYPGKHDSTTPTYANSDLAGVPLMYIEGEYADANGRAGGALTFRNATAGSILSYFADVGGGHFDWNDNVCEYIGMYLRKLGEHRLPDTLANDGTGALKTINTSTQGWMADRWRKGTNPAATPAAVGSYAGATNEAFWYFDQEHAQTTYSNQLPVKTQYQLLGYTQNGVLVDQQETHIQVQASFVPDPVGDGMTFKLGTAFLTNVPATSSRLSGWSGLPVGSAIGHSTNGPIQIARICGPVEQLSPDTFRINFDRVGTENIYGQWRSRDMCFMAVHAGDSNYVRAVQQGMIRIPLPLNSGTAQTITFPTISDQSISTASIPLVATSSGTNTYAGAKVDFYVLEGPAKVVNGNTLQLTAVPPRTKFPVKVTVVGTQFGRNIAPLLQTATPVTNTFYITATDIEQWRLQNFGSPTNAGQGADSSDPDGDGRDNSLERELGSDPNAADISASDRYQTWARGTNAPTPDTIGKYAFGGAHDIESEGIWPVLSAGGSGLVLTAVVRTNNPGLRVSGVYTTNLQAVSWPLLPLNPEGVASANTAGVPSGCQRRNFHLPIDAGAGFMRLLSTFEY